VQRQHFIEGLLKPTALVAHQPFLDPLLMAVALSMALFFFFFFFFFDWKICT
jgi:hypothetical protein